MDAWLSAADASATTSLIAIDEKNFESVIAKLGDDVRRLCAANDFRAENGRFLGIPAGKDSDPLMLAGCNAGGGLFALASFPCRLPAGDYKLDPRGIALDAAQTALGWALGAYR
jgi:leucyl aminopeptidase